VTIEYAAGPHPDARNAAYRRDRMIYLLGTAAAWAVLIGTSAAWPHTSNLLDPIKAALNLTQRVAGGAALAWAALVLRWMWRVPRARRDWVAWLTLLADAWAALALFETAYL
jgi:hypothetical protein